mgnify:CR=1 FL=1
MTDKLYNDLKLHDYSINALMVCLQKCLMEQSDITDILRGLTFVNKEGMLYCKNPPLLKYDFDNTDNNEEDE